jgi:hypothetical protein
VQQLFRANVEDVECSILCKGAAVGARTFVDRQLAILNHNWKSGAEERLEIYGRVLGRYLKNASAGAVQKDAGAAMSPRAHNLAGRKIRICAYPGLKPSTGILFLTRVHVPPDQVRVLQNFVVLQQISPDPSPAAATFAPPCAAARCEAPAKNVFVDRERTDVTEFVMAQHAALFQHSLPSPASRGRNSNTTTLPRNRPNSH